MSRLELLAMLGVPETAGFLRRACSKRYRFLRNIISGEVGSKEDTAVWLVRRCGEILLFGAPVALLLRVEAPLLLLLLLLLGS